MPNLSRIWTLYPLTGGQPSSHSVNLWVETLGLRGAPYGDRLQSADPPSFVSPVRSSEEAPSARTKQVYSLNRLGDPVLVDVGDPIGFETLRTRHRDLSTHSIFSDEDGREWHVEKFADPDGRRRWLQVDLVAYRSAPPVEAPAFTSPAGWTLEEGGEAVQLLTVAARVRSDDFYHEFVGLRFGHESEWTATGFVVGEFGVERPDGLEGTLMFTQGADPQEGLGAGEDWPGDGVCIIDGILASRAMEVGAVIRIKGT